DNALVKLRHVFGITALLALAACSGKRDAKRQVIGYIQVSSSAALDDARDGFFKALHDSGYVRDSTITILERNAQGDIPALSLIVNEFLQQNVTQVASISSVATQAAIKTITDRPVIFGAVANPYVIGAGTSPTSHRPNVTGAEIPLPVDSAIVLAHEAFPLVKAWGTLFDPSDPFAEFYLEKIKHAAKDIGVNLITVACTSPGDIPAGIQALKSEGAGGVVQIPSVMIGGAYAAVVKSSRQANLPLISTSTSNKDAPIALGLSFYQNGYDMGVIMIRVLRGESPANIPFHIGTRRDLVVDLNAARAFGVTIPPAIVNRADKVLGGSGPGAQTSAQRNAIQAPVRRGNNPFEFWLVAITQGLAFAALAWGVYASSRVLRFADITPDGSFTLGAAVAASLIVKGTDPLLATFIAILAGMIAGYITGLLHTRFGIKDLLAGILVMTALYSVNLHVMGKSNVSLLDIRTLVNDVHRVIPPSVNWSDDISLGILFLFIAIVLGGLLTWYLRTDFGMAMRAVGDNPAMIVAQGVDRRRMIELGLALANGLVALSGALIAQQQGFADINMGVGTLVADMAAVIMGETLLFNKRGLGITITMVAAGAIVFRLMVALALRAGLNPVDLKLATAAFVLAALALPKLRFSRGAVGMAQ
ncbi:MAG TPA: ABC transporter substrate binding protein, partial [Gemmatimonadaceae bacterium]|nr:ABC transporter substrate binding protein [Gemmatimonadaceae bacterium]